MNRITVMLHVESEGSDSSTSSSKNDVHEEFEQTNSWRLTSLEWCKCGHCEVMTKTIQSFCCCEKAVEYDEHDERLSSAQEQGFTCITFFTLICAKHAVCRRA